MKKNPYNVSKNDLRNLANYLRIEIKDDEFDFFLKSFENIKGMISNLSNLKTDRKIDQMERIIGDYLTLDDLEEIKNKYQTNILSKESIKKNASVKENGLITVAKSSL